MASWSTFDLRTVPGVSPTPGSAGVSFDGRYVYFVPSNSTSLARYDTLAPFGVVSSFSVAPIPGLTKAEPFHGVAFDGRYLYLQPQGKGIAFRFDAKTPPSMPPWFKGSFF